MPMRGKLQYLSRQFRYKRTLAWPLAAQLSFNPAREYSSVARGGHLADGK